MHGMEIFSILTARGDSFQVSEDSPEIGKERVIDITEHKPAGPGDSLYYKILVEANDSDWGFKKRIRKSFDPVEVIYEEIE